MEDVVPDLVDGPEHEFSQAEVVDLRETVDDAPIIKLANQIIAQAVEQGASDIHLEPETDSMRVRLRIDGVLNEAHVVPRAMVAGVVSRIKVMAELDIAERRVPQDGRVGLSIDGHHVDLRVVTLPSVHGESVVMRILDKESVVMDLDRLGMGEDDRQRFERAIHEPYGAVLVTGPTGSGKSTSLYAALGVLNTPEKNIVTIEDPVEYQLEGVTQVQVNPRAGLGFATGLRADDARRSRHHHGRRDPRPRDGADRRRGGAHRPPRPLDAAHERRGDRDHPPRGDGRRAVPRRQLDRLRRRPAPRPHAVPALQAARDHPGRDAARQRLPVVARRRGLRARRAAPAATAPATRAASASTRSWS